jgi:hypothetical protein
MKLKGSCLVSSIRLWSLKSMQNRINKITHSNIWLKNTSKQPHQMKWQVLAIDPHTKLPWVFFKAFF